MALGTGAAVEPVLLAHRAVARNFRGIRFRGGQSESIPFDDPSFIEGLKVLERLGLTWDCCGPETHPLDLEGVLGGICRVARACPSLTIIVDHCGGAVGPLCFDAEPEKRAEWERTRASRPPNLAGASGLRMVVANGAGLITELASLPNTYMKVGGLQMQTNGERDRL